VPAERGRLRLGGLELGEKDHVVEREHQRRVAHLAERDLGHEQVALLDRAGEPSGCRALGCPSRRGPGGGESTPSFLFDEIGVIS